MYLQLIDELNTYDEPARGPWKHLWRVSETEYKYKFYTASGHGIDTSTTFRVWLGIHSVYMYM